MFTRSWPLVDNFLSLLSIIQTECELDDSPAGQNPGSFLSLPLSLETTLRDALGLPVSLDCERSGSETVARSF